MDMTPTMSQMYVYRLYTNSRFGELQIFLKTDFTLENSSLNASLRFLHSG